MTDIIALEQQYEFDVYPKRELAIVKGKNATLWDEQGNAYIDCVAGHGVASVGHCNDQVVRAIAEQAKQLITCSGIFYNDQRAILLKKLVELAPVSLTRAFLCNSGAEAIEAAIKFARYSTKKTDFICAMKSFHGRTMGAMTATFNPKYKEDYKPLVPGFDFVPYNNFEKLVEAVTDKTAAVLLEVVQGEGGVNLGDAAYFRQVRELCDQNNILLIIDEIQTGFCRTGKMFACDHMGIEPDMMTVAKALAGGFPIGAVLCAEKIEVPVGKHGSTFGGNPLACAAANAALDFMVEQNLAEQARKKGQYLFEKLSALNLERVREIRQLGLMVGLELKEKVKPYLETLMTEGVLALPAGTTVLRLLPPLTISYQELDVVAEKVGKVLA